MFKVTIEEIKQVPAFEKKYDTEAGAYIYTPIQGKTTDDNRVVYSQSFADSEINVAKVVAELNRVAAGVPNV